MIELILFLVVLFAGILWHWRSWRKTHSTSRSHRKGRVESEREAHYMRNFLTYDGSEQEEYEDAR